MDKYNAFYTYDGSVGLYSNGSEDIYHSVTGALTESVEKFIIPANIPDLRSRYLFWNRIQFKKFFKFYIKKFKKNF